VIWLLDGNSAANSFAASEWNPLRNDNGNAALGIPANLTFFSFAILALLGIETPLNMGVETTGGERGIRTYLLWGSAIVMVAYLWTTWGTMVSVPVDTLNSTTGGAQGVGIAMGKWLGVFVAAVLAWVFLTAAVVYNYAFARLLFVSGLERRLPHQVGKVNRNQVPANAVILQAVIATIAGALIFFVLGAGESDPYKYFYALYAGLTIVWCISTALLFLDIFFAERASPNRFEEARRVPRWVLNASGAVGTVANIVAVFFIFTGSWYPPGWPKLFEWNMWMLGITVVSVLAGILIYVISEQTRRGLSDEELLARGAAEEEMQVDMPPGAEPA
jgi:amino acid transporter